MPVDNYGVWKCHPVDYKLEQRNHGPKSPQLSLYFTDQVTDCKQHGTGVATDHEGHGRYRACINITSGDLDDSRLVYWVNHNIDQNPIIDEISRLSYGFHSAEDRKDSLGLDYIRHSLFNTTYGRLLPHDIPGQFNDIIDILQPNIEQAIREKAELYLFGSRCEKRNGMHNIHMNQGNGRKFRADDGVYRDGGLIFHFTCPNPGSEDVRDEWLGVFLAFASQAVHTSDETGHAISGVGWSDILRPDIIEDGVVIQEAFVKSDSESDSAMDKGSTPRPKLGKRRKSLTVTLSNRTDRAVRLGDWRIRSSSGCVHTLPRGAALRPRVDQMFELADCPLLPTGDTILLLNEHGLKVDGVSYNSAQGGMKGKGGAIVFAH
ncbi:uncharacterized protein DSM5745_08741 [Aspergillus mulundensis]|uniref:LTD domain-containing protein n=1 Tax=Aspergillus mulundensis TaxID=1810919 RepID=A0A3D8R4X2_9EURO|nr:Uncharacterized protein DSM5745_08741 [Aspergillus mulundensis]RDW68981.1 Uncharacterized protein DSM5745_08741 [Aspergillus mulundensis]